jgi:hypothetical protein
VVVPSGATTGNIVVTVNGVPSNAVNFIVVPAVTLSPAQGSEGTSVTITAGSVSFGASQGTSTVTFGGVAATPTSWNNGTITVPVPSGVSPGNQNVIVTVGGVASGASFGVVPVITSLTPSTGLIGQSVTIQGTTFGATQGSTQVSFTGYPTAAIGTPTNWSDTQIVVPVPSGTITGPLTVTPANAPNLASNGVQFTVSNAPVINTLSPSTPTPGTSVTLSGSNFGNTQGTSTVTFGGTAAIPTSWSPTQIVVTVPSGVAGGDAVVTVAGAPSNAVPFGPIAVTVFVCSGQQTKCPPTACVQAGNSNYGDAVTFSVQVCPKSISPSQPVPLGGITLHDGDPSNPANALGPPQPNKNGGVSFLVSSLTGSQVVNGAPVAHQIGASFDGDNVHYTLENSTVPVAWTVNPAQSAVNLVSSANPSPTGSFLTLTATVTGIPGGATPTGTVTFNDNFNNAVKALGQGNVNANGQATLSTNTLQNGQHTITAAYAGDNNYAGSTSQPLQETVAPIPVIQVIYPGGGPAGMGFTIIGVNFGTQGTVTVGGQNATIINWTDKQIDARVPKLAFQSFPVVVNSQSNNASSGPCGVCNFVVRDTFIPSSH